MTYVVAKLEGTSSCHAKVEVLMQSQVTVRRHWSTLPGRSKLVASVRVLPLAEGIEE